MSVQEPAHRWFSPLSDQRGLSPRPSFPVAIRAATRPAQRLCLCQAWTLSRWPESLTTIPRILPRRKRRTRRPSKKRLRILLEADRRPAAWILRLGRCKRKERMDIDRGVGAIRRRSWSEAEGRRCRGESPLLGDDHLLGVSRCSPLYCSRGPRGAPATIPSRATALQLTRRLPVI